MGTAPASVARRRAGVPWAPHVPGVGDDTIEVTVDEDVIYHEDLWELLEAS